MGLPQTNPDTTAQPAPGAPTDPMQSSSQIPTEPSTTGTTPTSLPPAALDLASKLFDYARMGSTSELSSYVGAGVPPNLTNHKGDTLLMLAAYHGHAETVKMLLSRGADPDSLNDRGQSVLAGAVFKGHDEVVEALVKGVEMGADGRRSKSADPYGGQPNAVDSARMFKKEGYLRLFGAEDGPVPGRIDQAGQ